MDEDESYRHPAVHPPSLHRVAEIAKSLNLDLSDEELKQYTDAMAAATANHKKLYDLVEPKLPVKYPRTPGYKPQKHENLLNAWYWKCDISGASSGKLYGKTIAIKDTIPVAGVPMMNGSLMLEGFIPDIDATIVTRVLEQGGQILGKATCESLCCSCAGFTSATGPVLNPVDPSRMCGGSSTGCGSLVANSEVDMALGGDQGGSIRIPAATCGIVGLKPTYGLVPYTGISSIDLTLDHTGPMARTVYDTALLLESIAGLDGEGLDPRQPTELKVPEYAKQLNDDIKGLRIGLVKEGFNPEYGSDVNNLVRKSAERFVEIGAVVEEVSVPWHNNARYITAALYPEAMFGGHNGVSGTSALMYYDTHLQQATARGMKAHPNDHSVTATFLRLTGRYMREDYNGIFYSKAQNLRRELKRAYNEALQKYHVLIMPTCPVSQLPPSRHSKLTELVQKAFQMSGNTRAFNLTGHPALTINAGLSEDRLPVVAGVTLDFVGDINFDGAPKYYNNEGLCSYSKTFANVAPLFNKSDFVIGNLESPFVQEDMKKDAQREFVPLLHANPSSIDALKFAGFDIVTLANNHLNDYKTRPINYTVDLLQEHGILSFGYSFGNLDNEQPQIPVILEKDDIKIGFLGYCSCYKRLVDLSTGDIIFYHFCVEKRKCLNIGPAIYSDQAATRDVKELKERVDVIVVMMHWGEEYLTTPTESQQQQAQHLQTIGVHVVIGAHPHVLEGHTLNGRSLIAYSLGNFLFGPKYMTKVFYANPDPSKKMMEGFEKLMATSAIDDNSLDSRILRVELNKQGVVRAAYIPIQISLNPKTKCLQPTPTNDTTWITVCGVDDKACLK